MEHYLRLILKGHKHQYEVENLCRVFRPDAKLPLAEEPPEKGDYVLTEAREEGKKICLLARVRMEGIEAEETDQMENGFPDFEKESEYRICVCLFRAFTALTGYRPKWGILTGVRPTKLMRRLLAELGTGEKALDYFTSRLFVEPEKAALCLATAKSEEKILAQSRPDSFSLYISIPFCPSRCSYCSFVSHSIEKAKKLLEPYVELLCREIEDTAVYVRELGLRLQTVYFGGGTPTTLSAELLKRVVGAVAEQFDMSHLMEYTVEAGRPDTVTREKLQAIREGGAGRVSINPQTMNNEVLERIGRRHNSEQTYAAYRLARETGFEAVNMDLIAGLPGDTFESFRETLRQVCALKPENITVHTLALKRSADLYREEYYARSGEAARMLEETHNGLPIFGYRPYYMYRQSKTAGNLENVGFCREGYEGAYNVFIMEEAHTILACGAGAVTKLREPGGPMIERVFNYKYPYEYISRFNDILNKKKRVRSFYEEYSPLHR